MAKLLDIFSKSESEKEKIKIIVDNREKQSLVPAELISMGFQIEFQQLPVADYITGDVAVERKTVADLKSSIISKRVFQQLQELKQFPRHLLIVEGINDEDLYSGIIHENALRGFLLSAALNYQTPIIFTRNPEDTAKYLALLAKKSQSPKSEVALRASKIEPTKAEQLQFILEGFPFVGPVRAKRLLEKFHSLKSIINATEPELESVLGKQARDFKELIE